MVLEQPGQPLRLVERPVPDPAPEQILVHVGACAVCRTDLHILDGELPDSKCPLILGHEIVGVVAGKGANVERFALGDRVGVPWLGKTCSHCRYCLGGRENLCSGAQFTGYTLDGGYAEFTVAHQDFCFPIPPAYHDEEAAPLMCAGLIGYRAWRAAGNAQRLGLYGFGAAAHIVVQVARHQGQHVFAFTKPGDTTDQQFARDLGAVWAGSSEEMPPEELDAAIIFAPVGALVPLALQAVCRGGTVVCAGIHMSDLPTFPYRLLWGERVLRSVANLTRRDGEEFLSLAPRIPVRTEVQVFTLEEANRALDLLRTGRLRGAAVLRPPTV
jgi:propanol-preferring alcohol dehydrogenase